MCPTGTSITTTSAGSTSEYRRAFDVIDADNDGRISGDDLRAFYSSLYNDAADDVEETVNTMIAVADANKDGYVQYDEFERVLKYGTNKGQRKDCYGGGGMMMMKEVFSVMDEDGDGRLGLDDLRSYLGRVGLKVSDDEIKAMILMGGGDQNYGVGFDGFVRILALHDFVS